MHPALSTDVRCRSTVKKRVTTEGIGLHGGERVTMTLAPGVPGDGIVFVRGDRDGRRIPASPATLSSAVYATTLAVDGAAVSTVEHLLSAAVGMEIDDLTVELNGGEVPILDGSALPFVTMLVDAGRVSSKIPRRAMQLLKPISISEGDKRLEIEPDRNLRITYAIDFGNSLIGRSRRTFVLDPASYQRDIAPARTFCRLEEVEALRQAGLALGGSLHNALVVDGNELLNGPLRFEDEFVRHKILDLLGDLALLGHPLRGHISVHRGGHALHGRLVEELSQRPDLWALKPEGQPGGIGAGDRPGVAADMTLASLA